jgi:hypothetical protein
MRNVLLSLAFVIFTLSGCSTTNPSIDVMRAESSSFKLPKLPEDGKAIVYVYRPSALGGLVRFNVFVDGQEPEAEMGYTRGSQYIYFNLAPGTHKILSKAENWAETVVDANAGDIIFIAQEPSVGIIMARNSIGRTAEIEGKYHIKRLELGTIIKQDR